MDTREFENIKAKIEVLKSKKAKAEGAMETIAEGWKATYKVSTLEEAQAIFATIQQRITTIQEQIDDLYKELLTLTNWNAI